MIGGIVPDDMDQSLVRTACFNFGAKLCGIDRIDGRWLDKGCVEGFQVERAMDINPVRPAVVGTAGFEPAFTQPYAGFV